MKLNANIAISTPQVLLVPYEPLHVARYHEWMQDAALREATASEPLSQAEERENQQSWRTARDKLTFILCRPLESTAGKEGGKGGFVVAGEDDAPARMVGDVNLFIHDHHPDDDDGEDSEEKEYEEDKMAVCRAEIDIMLAEKAFRGRGVARAAVCALLIFVRTHLADLLAEYSGTETETETGAAVVLRDLVVKIQEGNERSVGLFEGLGFEKRGKGVNYFGEWELVMERWEERVTGLGWWEGAVDGYREMEYGGINI